MTEEFVKETRKQTSLLFIMIHLSTKLQFSNLYCNYNLFSPILIVWEGLGDVR